MGALGKWAGIWRARRRSSTEYAANISLYEVLRHNGAPFHESSKRRFYEQAHLEPESGEGAFERLLWTGVIRYHRFRPPNDSVYKITAKKVRMPHLRGGHFYPPLRRDGHHWGPHPLVDEDIPSADAKPLSNSDAMHLLEMIEKAIPKSIYGDVRTEVKHSIFVDVAAGTIAMDQVGRIAPSYVHRVMRNEDDIAPLGTVPLEDWTA